VSARFTARLASGLVSAALLALGLGACGQQAYPATADANNNGGYVQAGAITYQLQVSRELNPYDVEDRAYLSGVTATAPTPSEEWYAVFLWAKNQSHAPASTSNSFDIVDTEGNHYYPVAINPQLNPYAWTSQTLQPLGTEPVPGSTAFFGPTQGNEVLFKINVTAYANRPVTLEIHVPGQAQVSTISLDL
jgi:hypothetical protein